MQDLVAYKSEDACIFKIYGESAERYLNGRCTQDLRGMNVGEARQSLVLNPQGKIEGKFTVLKDQDFFLLVTDPLKNENEKTDFLKSLLRFKVADQFEVESVSSDLITFYNINSDQLSDLRKEYDQSLLFVNKLADDKCICFLINNKKLTNHLKFISDDQFLEFRIKNKIPLMHVDIVSQIFAPDLPLDNFIKTGKGCYAGQEVVEMAIARGKPNRIMIAFECVADSKIESENLKVIHNEDEVGFVTSSIQENNTLIGLGFIKNKDYSLNNLSLKYLDKKFPIQLLNA